MNRKPLVALLLALVTVMLYLPVAWHDFSLLDDQQYVVDNPVVRAGLTWSGVKVVFVAAYASNWHPLTWISHMLDCQLFGLNPGAHHLVNVLFHTANALLLFLLLLRLTKELWPSAIVAAFFAWHPLHVESVAWIAERKDVLSTFFGLLALISYTKYAQEKQRRFFWFSLGLFACSLMSKSMLVTLPFVFLLLDWWPLGRLSSSTPAVAGTIPTAPEKKFRTLVFEKWPFFLLTIASCLMTYDSQRTVSIYSMEQFPAGLRAGNIVLAYGRYLFHLVWPANLVILYPLPGQLNWAWVSVAAALLVAVTLAAWKLRRNAPYLLFGWLWFVGTLVPVIGLVQAGVQAMADRYSYVPLVGIVIAAVFGLRALAWRYQATHLFALGAAAALVACVALTMRQISFWRSDEALFGRAVALTRDNFFARFEYGIALHHAGHDEKAIEQYRAALQIHSKIVKPYLVHENLGILLANEGAGTEAVEQFQQALALQPHDPEALINLGKLLLKLDRLEEAAIEFLEAAKYDTMDYRPPFFVGRIWLHQGHATEAIDAFHRCLELEPDFVQALVWLARIRAADADPGNRNGTEAIAAAGRANELTQNSDASVLDVLATAYAEAGQFENAVSTEQNALKLSVGLNPAEVAAMQERLQLFRAGKPYRKVFANE